ncbi:MAG: tetratricopeptide repeat protein [Opitutaceae bacterium]|nr:tetratricopeptide repeat protein [Opitutaceae bacterium]
MFGPARFFLGVLTLVTVLPPSRGLAQGLGSGSGSTPARTAAPAAGFGPGPAASVAPKLDPEARKLAEEIHRTLAPTHSPAEIGNTAVGLWMVGRLQVALHLMGKAVAADPANPDNQCNYAAMLTMSGGAELAIPLLEKLAQRYPQNSTVLNNLGQAYYQAGQEDEAEPQLARALAVAPAHPQAAATAAQIARAKGNTDQAAALAKQAVQRSLSRDKLNDLRKLRAKLTLDDLKAYRPADPDPLGLKAFTHPEFPRTAAEEARTRREWKAFYADLASRTEAVMKQRHALAAPRQAAAAAQAQAALAQLQSGQMPTAQGPSAANTTRTSAFSLSTGTPDADSAKSAEKTIRPRARRAELMLKLLREDNGAKFRLQQAKQALDARTAQVRQLIRTEYGPAYDKIEKRQAHQVGEGLANQSFCDEFTSLADRYLAQWSDQRAELFDAYLHQLRLKLSEEVYWKQFVQSKDDFRLTVLDAQIEWLAAYHATGVSTDGTIRDDRGMIPLQVDEECLRQKSAPRNLRLAHFNDVHCQYHSELNLGIGSIVTDCDKMVSTLGVGPVQLGLSQDMAQGTDFVDSFVSCNVEISAGKSAGVDVGPISVEVGAEGGLGVEIGRDGIQDIYVTGKVEATVADAVGSGVEGRMSLMSGSSSANILR